MASRYSFRSKSIIVLSMLFFLYRGILYVQMGSWLALIIPLAFLVLFIVVLPLRNSWSVRLLRSWAILLLLWGFARFLVEGLFALTPGITEAHIRDQFHLWGHLLSIAALAGGCFLWRKAPLLFTSINKG